MILLPRSWVNIFPPLPFFFNHFFENIVEDILNTRGDTSVKFILNGIPTCNFGEINNIKTIHIINTNRFQDPSFLIVCTIHFIKFGFFSVKVLLNLLFSDKVKALYLCSLWIAYKYIDISFAYHIFVYFIVIC